MKELLVATRNKGKIKEIREIIADIPYDIKTLADMNIKEDIPETGRSFEENAILKAKYAGAKTGLLTLADDSGLEIDALNGRPGIYSSRYKNGTDMDRINKVLEELQSIPKTEWSARFRSVVAIYNPENQRTVAFDGKCEGRIIDRPKGNNGFGYDPIFYSSELGKTFGEGKAEDKNKISHRARALLKARSFLFTLIPRANED